MENVLKDKEELLKTSDKANSVDNEAKCPVFGRIGHNVENSFHNPFNSNNRLKNAKLVDNVRDEESNSDESAMIVRKQCQSTVQVSVTINELCRCFPD